MTTLSQYERARAALAEATRIDEVLSIHDEVEHIKLYAKQIKDQALLADASEFQMRVERRLGTVIKAAKDAGEILTGRPKKVPEGGTIPARLEELGLNRHLSSRAQQRASISERAFEAAVQGMRERVAAGRAKIIDEVLSTEQKAERRANRERVLGECQQQAIEMTASDQGWPEHSADEALLVGRAAEHLVCADGLMRGWNAFLTGQGAPYDVVFEKAGRILRVQVKSAQWARNVNASGKNERIAYSFAALRRGKLGDGPRLSRDHADLIACVAIDIGVIAYLPIFECTSTIQLAVETLPDDARLRTYDRSIREYPLDRALSALENEHHYIEFKRLFPPFPRKQFGVLYADPPWSFQTWSEDGMDRSADNHYPTVSTELLRAVGPYVPAAKDSVLFLWATSPMLVDAIKVMESWGFDYKSSIVWIKRDSQGKLFQGTGYWTRNCHELLLVGTRGNVPAPAQGTQWPSVVDAPVREHSAKPKRFGRMIEEYFPHMPKLEMFCRGEPRKHWYAWGNQALAPHDPQTGEIAA